MVLCTGRVSGDSTALPTFGARGNMQPTRPDHVLVSQDTLPFVVSSLVRDNRRDSDHYPLETLLRLPVVVSGAVPCAGRYLQRVHWARGARNDYTSALGTIASENLIASHEVALAGHVDVAFETLDAGIRAAAASCGMPTVEKRDRAVHRAHAPFSDAECRALKRHVQAMANRGSNPSELRAMERRYHSLVRSKRRAYRVAQLKHLIDEQYANPRSFWKRFRGQNGKLPEQLRPVQSWDAYLQQLAGQPMLDVPPLPDMAYPVHPACDLHVTS